MIKYVNPLTLTRDVNQRVSCGAELCEEVKPLKHMSVWTYMRKGVRHYTCFCSTEHALMCMEPGALHHA